MYAELSSEAIKPIKYTLGDINGDGFVDTVDASQILAEYARLSTKRTTVRTTVNTTTTILNTT